VEHHPRGLIAAEAELPLQQQGREPTLVRCHQVGGPEPRRERGLRIVKNCPRRQRDLVTAGGALPPTPASQGVGMRVPASRTGKALRPATRHQVVRAPFFAGELRLKLPKVLGEGQSGHPFTLPIVSC
jgi:hypothetical protein